MKNREFFRKMCAMLLAFGFALVPAATGWAAEDPMQIDDVLATVDMSAVSSDEQPFLETRRYDKASLLALTFPQNSNRVDAKAFVFPNRNSGANAAGVSAFSGFPPKGSSADPYKMGTPATLTVSRDADGGMSGAWRIAAANYTGTTRELLIARVKSEDRGIGLRDTVLVRIPFDASEPDNRIYPCTATDISAGLAIGDDAVESYAIGETARNGTAVYMALRIVPGDAYDMPSLRGLRIDLGEGRPFTATYGAVRTAAGDLDGDGIPSEVAVVFDRRTMSAKAHDRDQDGMYQIRLYKITRRNGALSSALVFQEDFGALQDEYVSGHDVVTGDFDGDGRREIAVVYNRYYQAQSDEYGYPAVRIYKVAPDGTYSVKETVDRDHPIGEFKGPHYHIHGLVARAGDLEGDGRDEIVWAALAFPKKTLYVSAWGADDDLTPRGLATLTTDYDTLQSDFQPQNITMALAPLMGNMNPNTNLNCMEIAVGVRQETLTGGARPTVYFVHQVLLDRYGKISGISSPKNQQGSTLSSGQDFPVLLAADFAGESVVLGPPVHYMIPSQTSCFAIIQAPPYHVDYVDAPWDPSDRQLRNFTWVDGMKSGYSIDKNLALDAELRVGASLNFGLDGQLELGAKLPASIVQAGGNLDIGASLEAGLDFMAKGHTAINSKVDMATNLYDSMRAIRADYHMWRYPILGSAAEPGEVSGDLEDRTEYIQYSFQDKAVFNYAPLDVNMDGYAPMHETGNLFSYPVKLSNTIGYPGKDALRQLLTGEQSFTLGDTENTMDLAWNSNVDASLGLALGGTLEMSSSMSLKAAIPVEVVVAKIGGSISGRTAATLKLSPSFSTTIGRGDQFSFFWPGSSGNADIDIPSRAPYTVTSSVFRENRVGTLHMAYAVQLGTRGSGQQNLWVAQNSPYRTLPDPALNMPFKWYLKSGQTRSEYAVFTPNDKDAATKMRGLRIFDSDGNSAGYLLAPGETYRVECPIYNYSFVPTGASCGVRFTLAADDGAETEIGRATLPPMNGWDGVTENKTTVAFDWTVPSGLAQSRYYRLYAHIDPENTLAEIHEEWDADLDPGGNNKAYVDVGFLTEGARESAQIVSATRERSFAISLSNMTPEQFRKALEDGENVWVEGIVVYTGEKTASDVWIDIYDGEPTESGPNVLLASRNCPVLIPGRSKTFGFLLQPSRLASRTLFVSVRGDGLPTGSHTYTIPLQTSDDGSSGGGCDSGLGALCLLLPGLILNRKKKPASRTGKTRTYVIY